MTTVVKTSQNAYCEGGEFWAHHVCLVEAVPWRGLFHFRTTIRSWHRSAPKRIRETALSGQVMRATLEACYFVPTQSCCALSDFAWCGLCGRPCRPEPRPSTSGSANWSAGQSFSQCWAAPVDGNSSSQALAGTFTFVGDA